jgi:hypothetical protein
MTFGSVKLPVAGHEQYFCWGIKIFQIVKLPLTILVNVALSLLAAGTMQVGVPIFRQYRSQVVAMEHSLGLGYFEKIFFVMKKPSMVNMIMIITMSIFMSFFIEFIIMSFSKNDTNDMFFLKRQKIIV